MMDPENTIAKNQHNSHINQLKIRRNRAVTANSLYNIDDTFSKIFFLWLFILTVKEFVCFAGFFVCFFKYYLVLLYFSKTKIHLFMSSYEVSRHF